MAVGALFAMSTPVIAGVATGVCNHATNYSVVLKFASAREEHRSRARQAHVGVFALRDFLPEQVSVRAYSDGMQYLIGYIDIHPARHNLFRTFGTLGSGIYSDRWCTLTVD